MPPTDKRERERVSECNRAALAVSLLLTGEEEEASLMVLCCWRDARTTRDAGDAFAFLELTTDPRERMPVIECLDGRVSECACV